MKSKKLRFKKLAKVTYKPIDTLKHDSELVNCEVVDDTVNVVPKAFQGIFKNTKRAKKHVVPSIKEYGNYVDGYRFIAFHDSQIPMENGNESSNSSVSLDEDPETDDDEFNKNSLHQTLFAYISKWEKIIHEPSASNIPLPVATGKYEDVNVENVKSFLKNFKNTKTERVRWHPDKMKGILKQLHCDHLLVESQITHVFQIINTIYETWDDDSKE